MASASVSVLAILLLGVAAVASAQLSATFYDMSCPRALATIRSTVAAAVSRDPRMGASLLRLHFHDCFVQGCDASVLLADTANFRGEQGSFPNRGSLRGFDVVDGIKAQVEAVCPRTVSCADILAVAARDSVVALGGSPYTVLLGRRDSTTASLTLANSDLPAPSSDLATLIGSFSRKGLSTTDMVALSGAHTIGQVQCANFRSRIYGEPNLNSSYAASLRANCSQSGGDGNLAPLDATPNAFDNAYFGDLLAQRGLLHSDQQLFNGGSTDALVRAYASSAAQFGSDFAAAMVRMGSIGVLTGNQGEIRLSCSKVN
ncbi:peroxidase 70-like [Phragmites australis]|uniref:peroxidase 70-like n=1 Tax=Phragmites australis TaxID=29695 RepID=UPI002D768FB6|nr:peroxidase 70-like [Phragmites australis]